MVGGLHTEAAALHHDHSVGLIRRQVVQRPDRVVPDARVGGRGAVMVQHRQRIRADYVGVVVALLTELLWSQHFRFEQDFLKDLGALASRAVETPRFRRHTFRTRVVSDGLSQLRN